MKKTFYAIVEDNNGEYNISTINHGDNEYSQVFNKRKEAVKIKKIIGNKELKIIRVSITPEI